MNIYKYLVYDEKKKFQEEVGKEKNQDCYLALNESLSRNHNKADIYMSKCVQDKLTETENALILEAKSLLSYALGNFKEAKLLAENAVELNKKLFFSRSVLARLAEFDKNYDLAMSYYNSMLSEYPNHGETQLNIAQLMLLKKYKYNSITQLVAESPASFRRFMYICLIPVGKPFVRAFLLAILFGIFLSSWVNNIFWILLLFTFLLEIYSLYKLKWDNVIMTRIIFIQLIIFAARFLVGVVGLF